MRYVEPSMNRSTSTLTAAGETEKSRSGPCSHQGRQSLNAVVVEALEDYLSHQGV